MKVVNGKIVYGDKELKSLADKFKKYWKKNIDSKLGRKFFYIIGQHKKEIEDFRISLGLDSGYFEKDQEVYNWIDSEVKKIKIASKGIKYNESILPFKNHGLELEAEKEKNNKIYPKREKSKRATFDSLLEKKIKEFMAKIGLDGSWYLQFQRFIFFGDIKMRALLDCGIKISRKLSSYPDGLPFEGKVILELSPNTRLKDIEFIWGKQVKPLLESLPGFIKIPSNKKVKRI